MMKKLRAIAVLAFLMAVLVVGLAALPSGAADHLEAPLLQGRGQADINDVYAFVNGSNTVLVMTVNPFAGVLSPTTLRPSVRYEFAIDNDGDYVEDIVYQLRASQPRSSGSQRIALRQISGGDSELVARGMSEANISVDGGGHLFAGLRDDPFFFDLVAFQDQVKGAGGDRTFCDDNANDFFAGANVTTFVLEVPSDMLTAGSDTINIWARTRTSQRPLDRMGKPAIATVLIPDGSEDAFNATKPKNDVAVWGDEVTASLLFLSGLDGSGYTQEEAEFITSLLLPDVLTLDTTSTAGFVSGPLNGRQLPDDVIDFELFVVTGGLGANGSPVLTSDCVDSNDKPFSDDFPYVAPPH